MSNYTYQHDPRISGADFEDNEKPDMCPKCQSDNTDFTPCSRCVGTGGFESGNGWDEPRSWDACDDCGGMGGQYVCYACDHVWEQEPTEEEVKARLDAHYSSWVDEGG